MKREWHLFIQDIHDAMQFIKEFVGTMNQREFFADEKTRSAVAFKIENIEFSRMLKLTLLIVDSTDWAV